MNETDLRKAGMAFSMMPDEMADQFVLVFSEEMGFRMARMRLLGCKEHEPIFHAKKRLQDWIGEKRECTCLSQEDAARQLSISQAELSRIESGDVRKSSITLRAFRSVFKSRQWKYILFREGKEIHERHRHVRVDKHGNVVTSFEAK